MGQVKPNIPLATTSKFTDSTSERNNPMAHQIENMAYVGQTPWHGLGNQLTQTNRLKSGHSRQAWTGD
jgi:hypothetical protein